jgi:hypothetical protein
MVKQKRICSICKKVGHNSNNSKFHPKKIINKVNQSICLKFEITKYLKHMSKIIKEILSRPEKNVLTYDILDTEIIIENKMIVLKEKQRQMKIGEIWQEVLGNYNCYNVLKNHESGLDIISYTKKIVIELKNRTNTDNSSSRKTNLDKLSKFKKSNPEYTCIYANINDSTKDLTIKGSFKTITHNGVEIKHYIGYKFLEFVLGKDTDKIIDFVRKCVN